MSDQQPTAGGDTAENADPYMQEITNLGHLVGEARQLVKDGNVIDMSNFQDRVADLCKAIAENPPSDTDAIMAAIHVLVTDLNQLAEDLKALHPEIDS